MNKKPTPFSDFLTKEIRFNPKPEKQQNKLALPKIAPSSGLAFGKSSKPTEKKGFIRRLLDKELHKHPFAIPVIVFTVMAFASMLGLVLINSHTDDTNNSHVVQLSVDNKKIVIPTRAPKVGDFLARSKVKLNDGDVVEPSADTVIDADDFRVNVYRAKPVTIIDGNRRIQALSAATTPRAVAAQAGVQVHAEDKIAQANPKDVLRDSVLGAQLIIERATPVNLNLYGTAVTIRTHAKTIADLLKEKNITIAGSDTVMPTIDEAVTTGMQVFITRVGTKIESKTEEIPNEQQIVEDTSLSFGTVALRQAGSPGKKLVTYQIELQNGVETGRKVIQEVRVQEPVARITARGKAVSIPSDRVALMRSAGIAESDFPYAQFIINHENGMWCPTRWQGQYFCPPYYEEKFPGAESNRITGYGMCQSTPAIKMATAGSDWRTNPVTQLKWCSSYASRYGGWQGAYEAWIRRQSEGRGWW